MNNILQILLVCTVTSNVCVCNGFGVPLLLANKRSFAYTGLISLIFAIVLTLSGLSYYLLYNYVLKPFGVEFLRLIVLVLLTGIFNFVAYYILKAINKEVFFIYEKSYTFMFMFVSILAIVLSFDLTLAIVDTVLTFLFYGLGFTIVNFIIYGAYFKLNGTLAPKYMRGLPLVLLLLSIIGLAVFVI
ncbi:MAG: hypothetical protein K6F08_00890 [bacterium]|nr:hypothetical protein [bacterium]